MTHLKQWVSKNPFLFTLFQPSNLDVSFKVVPEIKNTPISQNPHLFLFQKIVGLYMTKNNYQNKNKIDFSLAGLKVINNKLQNLYLKKFVFSLSNQNARCKLKFHNFFCVAFYVLYLFSQWLECWFFEVEKF